ncbi:hypothetical protein HA49_20040 [Tatumella morbirosei]|uniref:Uncharacterized protein n=1 Tax=Tatumella morbirosei TaxID=642227 RepID=A0A095U845_9GAMM|nr:hypothetical protein HA49_20040 [Tatumella morbirosei]
MLWLFVRQKYFFNFVICRESLLYPAFNCAVYLLFYPRFILLKYIPCMIRAHELLMICVILHRYWFYTVL